MHLPAMEGGATAFDQRALALPTFPSWHRTDCHAQALLADALASVRESGPFARNVGDGVFLRACPQDSPKRLRAALLSDLGLDEAWLAAAEAKNLADLQALGQQSGVGTDQVVAHQPESPPGGREQAHKGSQSDPESFFGKRTAAVNSVSRGCPVSNAAAGPSPPASRSPGTARTGVAVYPRRKRLSAYTASSTVSRSDSVMRPKLSGAAMIIDREALEPLLHLPQKIAAAHLNICVSSLKRISRKLGIPKWKDWREK